MQFDLTEIMEMIPHRYPFLLIDKIIDFIPKEKAVSIKNVTANEQFFVGHFPQKPIMPGVLIIESMAQTCAICAIASLGEEFKGKAVYFTSINEAKFRKPVVPGDVLQIQVLVSRIRSLFWMFTCQAIREENVISEAKISATIENSQ